MDFDLKNLEALNKIESILKRLEEFEGGDWDRIQDLMMELKDIFESSKIGDKKEEAFERSKKKEWYFGHRKLFYCFEDLERNEERCNLTSDGYMFLKGLTEYPEMVRMAHELNETWDKVSRDDVILTHKPFPIEIRKIQKMMDKLVRWNFPYPILGRSALERAGLKGFHVKRFRGGDWLYTRIRKDGTVKVSKSETPDWAIGYLIGKKGKRAKELGIRVEVLP